MLATCLESSLVLVALIGASKSALEYIASSTLLLSIVSLSRFRLRNSACLFSCSSLVLSLGAPLAEGTAEGGSIMLLVLLGGSMRLLPFPRVTLLLEGGPITGLELILDKCDDRRGVEDDAEGEPIEVTLPPLLP